MRVFVLVAAAGAAIGVVAGCSLDTEGLATGAWLADDAGGNVPDVGHGSDDVGAGADDSSSGGGDGASSSSGSSSGSGSGGTNSSGGSGSSGSSGSSGGNVGACVAAIPSGWRLVAYEASRGACPSGYASHDAYIGATANAGACTCGCTIGTPPNCTTGPVPTLFGNGGFGGNQCNGQGATLQASGSTCAPLQQGGSLAQLFSAQAITFSGGTCTGTASGDPSQVTKQGVRTCDVTSKDAESVCEGNAPQSFSACIESDGDVPCPAGSPFSNKTSVADDEMLVCSGCTSCTVSGSCANAQVQFFGDAQCAKSVTAPLAASGQCVPTNASGKNVVAFEYTAQTNATCQAAGTSASFTPVMPRTICCR